MATQLSLDPVIASHIAAINSFDVDAMMYQGNHADIDLAYAHLGSYIAEHELAVGWQLREYYHRDYSHTSDYTRWRTEIAWPIIDTPTD